MVQVISDNKGLHFVPELARAADSALERVHDEQGKETEGIWTSPGAQVPLKSMGVLSAESLPHDYSANGIIFFGH